MKRTLTAAVATTAMGLSLFLVALQPAAAQPPPPAVGVHGPGWGNGVIRNAPGEPPHYHRSQIHHSNDWGFGFGPAIVMRHPVVVTRSRAYGSPAAPPANFLPTPSSEAASVVLLNPKENNGPVNYALNAIRYTMLPGYEQKLPAGRTWTLEFDRGGSFGRARYTLTPGTYAFAVTERGWDVSRRTDSLTTDPPPPPAPALAQASP